MAQGTSEKYEEKGQHFLLTSVWSKRAGGAAVEVAANQERAE